MEAVDPVEFTTQPDFLGGFLCDVQVDEVEYVDFHVFWTPVSIPIEMSRHFGFLHVMHHLVEVTLESLFQAVFGLAYILFLTSSAGDAVDEVVAVAGHVVSCDTFYL